MKALWEILVPEESNDGIAYPVEYHREWDEKVRNVAGGLTILRTAKGQWVSPDGKLFKEMMIPVRIACTEDEIEKIMDLTIEHYDQEQVMAIKVADQVKFRKR